ncbi:alkaline phosphatase family protein, partial [Candidatus Aminicenantes bacterium AC-708-M15]|nr:alkaline phosphatase family protein [Candidatus Aminicenantes bacterium AC-708-M15]
ELSQSLIDKNFNHFPVEKDLEINLVTMIEYHPDLKTKVAFPPLGETKDTLSEVLSKHGINQVKISESEKAIHVSYFFNGKRIKAFPGENTIVIPSPSNIKNYNEKPEMSIEKVSKTAIAQLKDKKYDFFLVNFANVDVVGHIEDEKAVQKAVEAVDFYMGKVVKEALNSGITVIVTADHGTVEEWLYPEGTINTGHTKNPVPFILIDPLYDSKEEIILEREGNLIDVAPTILSLFNIPKPESMTGKNLILNNSPILKKRNRILLLILDGWGLREEKHGNMIAKANTPNFDYFWKNYPSTKLNASGESVGMPAGTVGNSEAGHLHLGAGRIIYSDRLRIDKAIEDGSFFQNKTLLRAMNKARDSNKSLHLMGIVSFYSSHGTIKHLFALLKMVKNLNLKNVYIHSFLGRRGERPESGAIYIEKVENEVKKLGVGKVVSVIGRYWALDREENWDRIEKTYKMLVYGEGKHIFEL